MRAEGMTAKGSHCIVMICPDQASADQVKGLLEEQDAGCLVTYRCAHDLVSNAPRATVALVVIVGETSSPVLAQTVRWLGRHWPNCPVWVVGEGRDQQLEIAARSAGANFLAEPVTDQQWSELLRHSLALAGSKTQRRGSKTTR